MHRRLTRSAFGFTLISLSAARSYADNPLPTEPTGAAPADMGAQAIDAAVGLAAGGSYTPGGLRVAGHYLYQLSDQDWFDGAAAFTFGGGGAACFYDRNDVYTCTHGIAQGDAVELQAGVRHYLPGKGAFWPYARVAVGLGAVHFPDDVVNSAAPTATPMLKTGITGFTISGHAGAGLRASILPSLAVIGDAEFVVGMAEYGSRIGVEKQIGMTITVGAEFKL